MLYPACHHIPPPAASPMLISSFYFQKNGPEQPREAPFPCWRVRLALPGVKGNCSLCGKTVALGPYTPTSGNLEICMSVWISTLRVILFLNIALYPASSLRETPLQCSAKLGKRSHCLLVHGLNCCDNARGSLWCHRNTAWNIVSCTSRWWEGKLRRTELRDSNLAQSRTVLIWPASFKTLFANQAWRMAKGSGTRQLLLGRLEAQRL